jgi:hypothetical protein
MLAAGRTPHDATPAIEETVMIRYAAIAAVVLTAAAIQPVAAQAQSVTVKVAGKSDAAVQSDIHRAAHEVCANANDFQVGVPQSTEALQCERLTERKTAERLRQAEASAASSQVATLTRPVAAKPH